MMECGKPSGPAPVLPRASSVLMPPVRVARNFLQLRFQFLGRELAPFEPVAGFDDLLDVQFENVASAKLAGRPFLSSQEYSQSPPGTRGGPG